MRRRAWWIALLFAVCWVASSKPGLATNWCSDITSPTTWTTSGSPYYVTCDVYVKSTLMIQPGVQVRFRAGFRLLVGNGGSGNLQAIGSSASTIDFTADSGSPGPGFWGGIQFYSGATASRISYATIHWAGTNSTGSVYVENGAQHVPTIDNTTIRDGVYAAISIRKGTPQLTTVTLTTHPVGIRTDDTSPSIDLTSVTITGNTGYAMSFDPRTTLGTFTGLTVSANNPDAIELRASGAQIDVTTEWKTVVAQSGTVPYVVTGSWINVGSSSAPFPVLTIDPGCIVKFGVGTQLLIGYGLTGQLQAAGSPTSRIELTSSKATPARGDWYGVMFKSGNQAASTMKYTNVRWAGNSNNGGVLVDTTTATFDHVLFDNNAFAGVATNYSTLTIQTCDFTNNDTGLYNATPSYLVTASLNWWNSTSGPSGGQTVSPGVQVEPWLMGSESYPQYFTSATQLDRTFNPQIGDYTKITFGTVAAGSWTLAVINSSGTTVRTFTGSITPPATVTVTWDGAGQNPGTYTYTLDSMDGSGHAARQAKGFAIIDWSKQISISPTPPALSQTYISPNSSPGIQDTTVLSTTANFDQLSWTVTIKTGSTTVRTLTGSGGPGISGTWDGKNTASQFVADGPYTLTLAITVGTSTFTAPAVTVVVDNTPPVATISAPVAGALLSNVKQNGGTVISITGTVSDTNITTWSLTAFNIGVATGSANQSGTLGSVDTFNVNPGSYSVVLVASDRAGNTTTTTIAVQVANFTMTQNVREFSAAAGGSVTYTSVIPALLTQSLGNLTVTLKVKNEAGTFVRTLVNGVSRGPNTYPDAWDGKGAPPTSAIQPDGGYFAVYTVTAGSYSMTWDPESYVVSGADQTGETYGSFDPFNNQPLAMTYTFGQPALTYIVFTNTNGVWLPCTLPGNYCPFPNGRYESSGTHSYAWSGADSTGKFRPDLQKFKVIGRAGALSVNAVVLYGTRPTVTGVAVTTPFFNPSAGSQTVSYTLGTYANQAVTVTITFLSQKSLTVLRTITQSGQTPGNKTATWDGKADNGMWVAPDSYLVTVTATDSLGNTNNGQIFSTVQY